MSAQKYPDEAQRSANAAPNEMHEQPSSDIEQAYTGDQEEAAMILAAARHRLNRETSNWRALTRILPWGACTITLVAVSIRLFLLLKKVDAAFLLTLLLTVCFMWGFVMLVINVMLKPMYKSYMKRLTLKIERLTEEVEKGAAQ